MSLFEEALGRAREAVDGTYGQPMTVTAMVASDYKAAVPDPQRPPLTGIIGVLHEHVTAKGGEPSVIERSDGGRPGGRFGVDIAAAPTRISFAVDTLGGWIPPEGTRIRLDGSGRLFEVNLAAPQNGGRIAFHVSEVTS